METVWKFSASRSAFGYGQIVFFRIPLGAKLLRVSEQRNDVALWFVVNPSSSVSERLFASCMTGMNAPRGRPLGTCLFDDGDFVLHIFEITDVPEQSRAN
jgi:hypothetical protein